MSRCIPIVLTLILAWLQLTHQEKEESSASCRPHFNDVDLAKVQGKAFQSHFWVLNDVCLEDETIVSFDPKVAHRDPTDTKLPKFDLSRLGYPFRHAAFGKILEAARRRAPPGDDTVNAVGGHNRSSGSSAKVTGLDVPQTYELHYAPLIMRYPTDQEVELQRAFSQCTVPLLLYVQWASNYGEYMARAPAVLHRFQEMGLLHRSMTPLLALPPKVVPDAFNLGLLRPLSEFEPASFRDFSRPVPPDTPSKHTAEGISVRCFKTFIIGRVRGGSYPDAARATRVIADWYRKRREEEEEEEKAPSQVLPWPDAAADAPDADTTLLRVAIEQRPYNGSRQFLDLESLLQECNKAPPIAGPSGRKVKAVCAAVTFDRSRSPDSFSDDLALMDRADVLVAFHGAGAMNSLFMRPRSSLVEVRPREFGTKFGYWPNAWHPQISRQSGWQTFFWGINVEDPELSPPGDEEIADVSSKAASARDRHVRLKWAFLRPVLQKIAQVDRQPERYVESVKSKSFLWLVEPGGKFGLAPPEMVAATMELHDGDELRTLPLRSAQ